MRNLAHTREHKNLRKTVVISVGGSLIAKDEIDTGFLKQFKRLVLDNTSKYRFVLIVGGGKTARRYQDAAKGVSSVSADDADWLGIHATRLNAHLLRTIFKDNAHKKIVFDPRKKTVFTEDILIAAGWKPGFSTDYDAVLLAKKL